MGQDAGAHRQAQPRGGFCRADQHGGSAVSHAGRVASRVHMLNLPELWLAGQSPIVQAIGAGLVHRAQRGQFLKGIGGADVLVVVQQQLALSV
jgi:hypothetical protein